MRLFFVILLRNGKECAMLTVRFNMKQYDISLQSLPIIAFAHEYCSDNYDITFPPQPNFIEISYNL